MVNHIGRVVVGQPNTNVVKGRLLATSQRFTCRREFRNFNRRPETRNRQRRSHEYKSDATVVGFAREFDVDEWAVFEPLDHGKFPRVPNE